MLVSLLPNSHPWNLAKELSWESGHWPVSEKYRAAACGRDRCKCLNNFYFQEKTRKKALHSIYLNLIVLLNAASTAPLYSCLWWRNDKGTSEGQMDRQSTANGQTACLGMRFQRVVGDIDPVLTQKKTQSFCIAGIAELSQWLSMSPSRWDNPPAINCTTTVKRFSTSGFLGS